MVAELSFSESVADLRRLAFFSLILQMATAAAMAPPATAVVTIHDVDDEEGISIHLSPFKLSTVCKSAGIERDYVTGRRASGPAHILPF